MIEINWSPFATNPLDFVPGHEKNACRLVTPQGDTVIITQQGTDFVVTIGDQRIVTYGNINTCYLLNCRQVGREG